MRRLLFILTLLFVGLIACGQTGTGWYPERKKVNFRDSTYFTKSANFLVPFRIGGTAVTSNAQELNILDGGLITYTELNNLLNSTSNIQTQLNAKQATLVSGTNIRTINGTSLLGSGNIVIEGGEGGSMVYPGAGIPLSTGTAWGTSITNNSVQWDSAYVGRYRWSGTAIGLNAATGRTSLGGTTIGQNIFTLTNPDAIRFLRINADNTVTALSAANFKTALSLTASDVSLGNVTNESKATMFTSPTFTGHPTIEGVTSTGATGSGNLVFSASPTFSGTVTGTFSGNLTGNVTGTSSLVTGFTRNSGTLTLSGGHGITLTTTGTTTVTLPTSGTLSTNPMTAAGDVIIGGASGVPTRLAATTNGYVLTLSSGAPVWAAAADPSLGTRVDSIVAVLADTMNIETLLDIDLDTDTVADLSEVRLKANIASPTFTGTVTIPTPFTLGATSVTASGAELNLLDGVTSIETYSTENYGATGTGDIVLSTGPTLTTVNITDVIKLTPTASPPAGATEGMIYADTDHHLYYYNGTGWIQLDN
jgi:hypothetical protein